MLADTAANPPGLSPMEQSRILAMAFLAGHDALNNIDGRRVYAPYALTDDVYSGADPAGTYEKAVCTVLQALMPEHATEFGQALPTSIVSYGNEWSLGWEAAQAVMDVRTNDGSASAQGPYVPGTMPGDYQPTPPGNVATFVNWGKVRPFAMSSGLQFRAPPPYAVTDAAYATDFDEVKRLGAATGSARGADQSLMAKFWLESTPLSWQRILADRLRIALDSVSLWDAARLFALLQVAQADAYIASLDSKYYYNFWRPITAIRAADTDGNPSTVADPAWEPFDPVTPPVPEYPSAHAAAGAAGAGILGALGVGGIGANVTYLSSTGSAPRSFSNYFPEDMYAIIAEEIGLSRIYVGYHFRHAVNAGWDQGYAIATRVLDTVLRPV